jgi:hypothetical protein
MIFDVIGTPSSSDVAHLGKVQQYLKSIDKKEPIDFMAKWPHAGKAAVDLLVRMLNFAAWNRITVDECLAHEFFTPVREVLTHSWEPVSINMEFIESLSSTYSLKEAIYNEILEWHPEKKVIG